MSQTWERTYQTTASSALGLFLRTSSRTSVSPVNNLVTLLFHPTLNPPLLLCNVLDPDQATNRWICL